MFKEVKGVVIFLINLFSGLLVMFLLQCLTKIGKKEKRLHFRAYQKFLSKIGDRMEELDWAYSDIEL